MATAALVMPAENGSNGANGVLSQVSIILWVWYDSHEKVCLAFYFPAVVIACIIEPVARDAEGTSPTEHLILSARPARSGPAVAVAGQSFESSRFIFVQVRLMALC